MTQLYAGILKYLIISEVVNSKTETGLLTDQPLHEVFKLLTGHGRITFEQT